MGHKLSHIDKFVTPVYDVNTGVKIFCLPKIRGAPAAPPLIFGRQKIFKKIVSRSYVILLITVYVRFPFPVV